MSVACPIVNEPILAPGWALAVTSAIRGKTYLDHQDWAARQNWPTVALWCLRPSARQVSQSSMCLLMTNSAPTTAECALCWSANRFDTDMRAATHPESRVRSSAPIAFTSDCRRRSCSSQAISHYTNGKVGTLFPVRPIPACSRARVRESQPLQHLTEV
jgi:hypothetical protein